MIALKGVMHPINSHRISSSFLSSNSDKFGGLLNSNSDAWFAFGSTIALYSKKYGRVMGHRSFANSVKITCVKELNSHGENFDLLLVGCSFKSAGLLYVCQLPMLTILRCIDLPSTISSIATISNDPDEESELCDEFKIMSTVLLIGMVTGAVYAVDLRHNYLKNQFYSKRYVEIESRLDQLFIIRKNEDCQEVKEMSDANDSHLALFINENFYTYCEKQYKNKLTLKVSSLLYVKEINTIAIGYSTGHFQLWDCNIMRTIYLLKEPKCVMPITHISFLEPSDDPNNLCYLWVIQSDNLKLPYATMIALTYELRTVMLDGSTSYKNLQGNGIKLEMSLKRETGFGRCVSALSLCNINLFRNKTDVDEDCEIKLFTMLLEIRRNVDSEPESYIFLFDINQWYKAQMPSTISHLKVSNSYASFVKLPHQASYLDFIICDGTLRPFSYYFRNNIEELYYPSSIYFECVCLKDTEIIQFKHAGIQQEILDELMLKNWKLLTNPTVVFSQCIETNLRPFFWDKPDDYAKYSVPDQRSYVVSIIVENQIMEVLKACAEEWKNGTYVSSEATILHLVKCLWKHVMVVKQYADKLCVPLFDYSGTQLDKKNIRLLNHCLGQMHSIKHFLQFLHNEYGIHVINVDYSHRIYSLNLVIDYFKAVRCFLRYNILPESLEDNDIESNIHCNFTSLILYAKNRRMEFKDSQLYLIDAIVFNEPKGNKLTEQWLHEGGEETRGLYPPTNVQCLLRIYLNAALSDLVKNFIIIYFLIDVCASQNLPVALANRMCNYALEVDVPNYEELNQICRACWLLDHDMLKEAINTFLKKRKWIELINRTAGDWFHWTVLKLFAFKSEYLWAKIYLDLVEMNIVGIDNHKFYVNVLIMNDDFLDVSIYIRKQSSENKDILYKYFFERCRETDKLKSLLKCPINPEEKELLYSFLKKFNDPLTLNCQLLYLLSCQKYVEAYKLNKSLEAIPELKNNDILVETAFKVNRYYKDLPDVLKQDFLEPYTLKKQLYSNTKVTIKTINNDKNTFCFADVNRGNMLSIKNQRITSSPPSLILPPINKKQKHSSPNDLIYNEKRRKTEDILLSPPGPVKEISNFVDKHVLEILNTPLVEKTISSPSLVASSSILKTGSTKKPKRLLALKGDEPSASRTVLRFSLPEDNNTTTERFGFENEQKSSVSNELTNIINKEPTEMRSINIPYCCEVDLLENSAIQKDNITYEQMEISEESTNMDQIDQENVYDMDSVINVEIMASDDEIEEMSVTKQLENHNSALNEDNIEFTSQDTEMETSIPVDGNVNSVEQFSPIITSVCSLAPVIEFGSTNLYEPVSFDNIKKIDVESSSSDSNSNDSIQINRSSVTDENMVYLNSEIEDEIKSMHSDSLSSRSSSESSDHSSESDLDETKYGRFKYQKKQHRDVDSVETSQELNEKDSDEKERESQDTNESSKENNFNLVVLGSESEEEIKSKHSDSSSSRSSSESSNHSSESDLDETKYGRFNYQKEQESNEDSDIQCAEENHIEENIDINEENEEIKSGSSDDGEVNTNFDNDFGQDNVIDNMLNTCEKTAIDDDIEIECSSVLKSDSCDEIIIHNSLELAKENGSQQNEIEMKSVKENVQNITVEKNDDSDVRVEEHKSYVIESIDTSNIENNCIDFESNKDNRNQFIDHTVENMPHSNNDNYNNTFTNEPNPIPEEGFNNLIMSGINSNVLETNNVTQSSTFMFGEPLFGHQEILDNSNPMYLFGQVYSSESEQIIVDNISNRNDTQNMTDTHNEVFPQKKSEEVEPIQKFEDLQDIIELKSLPDSNPDENLDVQNCSNNTLIPMCSERYVNNLSLFYSEVENIKTELTHCRTNIVRSPSEPKQCHTTVVDCSERAKSVPICLQNHLSHNNKSVNSLNKLSRSILNPDMLQTCDSNVMDIANMKETPSNCLEQQSKSGNDIKLQLSIKAKDEPFLKIPNVCDIHDSKLVKSTSVQKNPLISSEKESEMENEGKYRRSKRIKDAQLTNKTTVDMKNSYIAFDKLFDNTTNKQNIRNKRAQSVIEEENTKEHSKKILRRSTRAKSEQPLVKTAIGMEKSHLLVDKNINAKDVDSEKEQSLKDKVVIKNDCEQQMLQNDKKVLRSSRKSIKTLKDDSILQETPNTENTPIQIKENKSIIEQVDKDIDKQGKEYSKDKSISSSGNEKITRLRAKSESNLVHKTNSSINIFRPIEIVEEGRQKRVILTRKKSNDKQNYELQSRKRRCKSLTPMNETLATKTAFGLEKIIEEDTSNPDQLIEEVCSVRPSKFKFGKNKSKKGDSKIPNIQQNTEVKTPRKRSASLLPVSALTPPAPTLSLVKTPKRNASVGRLISHDETFTDKFMEYMAGRYDSAKKPKKTRPLAESVEKKTRRETTKKVEMENIPKRDESNLNDCSCFPEQLSAIDGNISSHLLYTPVAKKQKHTPIQKTTFNFESDGNYSDERVTRSKTKSIQVSSFLPGEWNGGIKSVSPKDLNSKEKPHSSKKNALIKKSTDKPLNVKATTHNRPVSRALLSKFESSRQSTSVIEQNEMTENKEEKKNHQKKTKKN